ncbi:MAG: hypothetical protein L0I76_09815 [Pseudonocardia sp.]|nr:hypothetical protein [Pseudonocardia sp.]
MIDKFKGELVYVACALAIIAGLWLALSWATSRAADSPAGSAGPTPHTDIASTAPVSGSRLPGVFGPSSVRGASPVRQDLPQIPNAERTLAPAWS